MKRLTCFLPALITLALFSGCQNPYAAAYKSTVPAGAEHYLMPHAGSPKLLAADPDLATTTAKWERKGYLVIGQSSFESDAEDNTDALMQKAQEAQADVVLLSVTRSSSRHEVARQSGFETGKDYSNQSSISGGPGPRGSTESYSQPTGYTTPTFVPREILLNNYTAVFMRKRVFVLGANIEAANETQQAQAGGRFAVAVVMVIEDSPAARADVRPGDLIVAVEGETFSNLQDYQVKINAHAGGLVHLGLQRGHTEKTVEARLNSLPHS